MADYMKSTVVAIGASTTTLLTGVSNGITVISMLHIGNVDGASAATVDLYINKDGGGDTLVLKGLNVAAGEMQVVYSYASGRLILDGFGTADVLKAVASAAGDLVATISYVERV